MRSVLTLLALVGATAACLGFAAPAHAAPVGDIVFLVDVSGSMAEGNRIGRARQSIRYIADELLADNVNARFAVVGFGGAPPDGPVNEPYIIGDLRGRAALGQALQRVGSFPGGGSEPGLWATEFAMENLERFRGGARKCAIMFADGASNYRVGFNTDRQNALAALNAKNARWLGIVQTSNTRVQRDYGLNPGSLAEATGGDVDNIDGTFEDPAVLDPIVSDCEANLGEDPAAFSASTTEGRAPLRVTFRGVQPGQAPYVWRFGDGSAPANGRTVSHTYTRPGNYTARLTAGGSTSRLTIHVLRDAGPSSPPSLRECTIIGTRGRDVLVGSRGRDVICGLGARDGIRGRGGNDIIVGGGGNDRINAGRGADSIFGQGGADRIRGQGGDDRIFGGGRGDVLNGGRGSDVLRGGGGNDGFGAQDGTLDYLFGGRGRDIADRDGRDVLYSIEEAR